MISLSCSEDIFKNCMIGLTCSIVVFRGFLNKSAIQPTCIPFNINYNQENWSISNSFTVEYNLLILLTTNMILRDMKKSTSVRCSKMFYFLKLSLMIYAIYINGSYFFLAFTWSLSQVHLQKEKNFFFCTNIKFTA